MDCKRQCIEQKKQIFCSRYALKKASKEEIALSGAISASTRYLKVYNVEYKDKRGEIRDFWKQQLKSLGNKYKTKQNRQTFEKDVEELQKLMNNKYKVEFTHTDSSKKSAGFRIAQAQKSLSVYLKHLWCQGVIPMPPVCPIDNVILTAIEKKGKDSHWGYINDMIDYKNRLNWVEDFVKRESPYFTIAEWELLVF